MDYVIDNLKTCGVIALSLTFVALTIVATLGFIGGSFLFLDGVFKGPILDAMTGAGIATGSFLFLAFLIWATSDDD